MKRLGINYSAQFTVDADVDMCSEGEHVDFCLVLLGGGNFTGLLKPCGEQAYIGHQPIQCAWQKKKKKKDV